MRNYLFFFFLLLFSISTNGQNLLANPSFESVNYCEVNVPCSPAAWYSVSDYPFGYEPNLTKVSDGKRALAFLITSAEGMRSYWQTPILCKLEKGREYSISFDVNPINEAFNPAFMGITFMDKLLNSKKDTIIQLEKNLYLETEKTVNLKNGWVRTSTIFTATGNEVIFIIGNFSSISNENLLKTVPAYQKYIGYYIDNISLMPTDKTIKICAESTRLKDSLFAANSRHTKIDQTTKTVVFDKTYIKASDPGKDTIVLGTINFDFDSDELTNTSLLKNYFNSMNQNEILSIHIIGYTDSTGSNAYNLKLSERRAISVKNYLIEKSGLPHHFITINGKGIARDQEQLELNRRVEIIISKKKQDF